MEYQALIIIQVSYDNADHLGGASLITDKEGWVFQTLEYAPFGELLLDYKDINRGYNEPYRFTGYMRDGETGLDYAHARYYDPELGIFISPDIYSTKKPHVSGYAYALNNPLRHIDPDGKWEWDTEGNLAAQKGDNAYSLAKFLGTNLKNSLTMLNRGGYTVNSKGILNLKIGDKLTKNDLWVGFKSAILATENANKQGQTNKCNLAANESAGNHPAWRPPSR